MRAKSVIVQPRLVNLLSYVLISPELSRTLAFGYRDPKATAQETIFSF